MRQNLNLISFFFNAFFLFLLYFYLSHPLSLHLHLHLHLHIKRLVINASTATSPLENITATYVTYGPTTPKNHSIAQSVESVVSVVVRNTAIATIVPCASALTHSIPTSVSRINSKTPVQCVEKICTRQDMLPWIYLVGMPFIRIVLGNWQPLIIDVRFAKRRYCNRKQWLGRGRSGREISQVNPCLRI